MTEDDVHPTLTHANTLLAERFERVAKDSGHEYATQDLRAIVSLGVEKVVARAAGRPANEAIRYVLTEVTSGRTDKLMEEIAADVQDLVKQRSEQYLFSIKTRHGILLFLPDVYIPMTVPVFKDWQQFLDSVDPTCLRVEDPLTRLRGRIPFRAGQWLGNLTFVGNAKATIATAITEVVGNLMLRGHQLDTQHTVTVGGDLYADRQQLQNEPSFIDILSGALRIYTESFKGPGDLALAPDDLTDWGAGHGTLIHLNDRISFRLLEEQGPDGPIHALAEVAAGRDIDLRSQRHVWNGETWQRFTRELPPETGYEVLKHFRRTCALLNLGNDFVIERPDAIKTVGENTERIAVLLALTRGEHSAQARKAVPQLARDRITRLEKDFLRLRALVMGEGPEFYRDMQAVEADIRALLKTFGDNRLRRLHKDMTEHCQRIPRHKVRHDRDYLALLAEGDALHIGDVLGTAGRTLVFLNNLCSSRQAKRLAAGFVGKVRDAIREVLGTEGSQTLLLQLLKFSDKSSLDELRSQHKDKDAGIIMLSEIITEIENRKPLEVVREFRMHRYSKKEPELEADKALLSRILGMHKGTLDEVFARAENGFGAEDGRILQNALLVNLQSFIVEGVKARPLNLDQERPSHVVAELLAKLDHYRPVMAEFNRLCASGTPDE